MMMTFNLQLLIVSYISEKEVNSVVEYLESIVTVAYHHFLSHL